MLPARSNIYILDMYWLDLFLVIYSSGSLIYSLDLFLVIYSSGSLIYSSTLLVKKFKGASTLWQIAVKTDIPSFDTNIQKN